jgi:hypothetical protein
MQVHVSEPFYLRINDFFVIFVPYFGNILQVLYKEDDVIP